MSIPQQPSNPGPFLVQHGYADISFKTHSYLDQPTPFPGQQGKAQAFLYQHTDREHQKKYGKKIFNFLINTLCK